MNIVCAVAQVFGDEGVALLHGFLGRIPGNEKSSGKVAPILVMSVLPAKLSLCRLNL